MRTTVLTVSGFALFTAAGLTVSLTIGLVVAGVSLLVLEALADGDPRP